MSDVFNLSEPIVTERLELTPLRVADADAMVDVLADPALHAFIGGDPPTRDDLVARYRAQTAGPAPGGGETWRNWIVREQPSLRPIGFVQATIQDAGDGTGGSAENLAVWTTVANCPPATNRPARVPLGAASPLPASG